VVQAFCFKKMNDRWKDYLSGTMLEIAELVGVAATVAIWEVHRHQEVWIASDSTKNMGLQELIGVGATRLLSERFGGSTISIPARDVENIVLAQAILLAKRTEPPTANARIAKQLKISRARVIRLLKTHAPLWAITELIEQVDNPIDRLDKMADHFHL
jgi:hypothetical protein